MRSSWLILIPAVTCSVAMRLMVDKYVGKSASLGSPGVDNVRWLKPVRPGDVLHVRHVITGMRASQTKPDRGFVNFQFQLMNQNNELVMEQRNGRVDRKGQRQEVFVFNLLLASTYEGRVLARVLAKLEKIREDVGGDSPLVEKSFDPSAGRLAPNREVRSALGSWFDGAGYEVAVATSFAEGRDLLRLGPDVVVAELKLGEYNGLHLADRPLGTQQGIQATAEASLLGCRLAAGHQTVSTALAALLSLSIFLRVSLSHRRQPSGLISSARITRL